MGTRWRFVFLLGAILVAALALYWYAPAAVAANLISVDLWHRTAKGERALTASRVNRLASLLQEGAANRLRALARLQAADGDLSESERTYRTLLAQRPGDVLAAFDLANLLARQGREEEAIPLWRQARSGPYWSARGAELGGCGSDLGGGLYYLQLAVQIDPANGPGQYHLGKRLAQCERWEEAITAFSVAIESGDVEPMILTDAFSSRGLAKYEAGLGLEPARVDLERAGQLQPHDPWPWIRLGTMYRQERRYAEALAACDRAVALAPKLAFAYHYRGQVWRASGDLERAAADFERALSLDPELQAARHFLEQINQRR